MATQAQVDANRRNAQRSTGPRTRKGKAVAAGNALKHGLLATAVLLEDEDAQLFQEQRDAIRARLDPEGALEDVLVERIVGCAWRLRRVGRIEASVMRYHVSCAEVSLAKGRVDEVKTTIWGLERSATLAAEARVTDERQHAAASDQRQEAEAARDRETLAVAFTAANQLDTWEKLSRYEVAIERSFYRALQELQQLQGARRGRTGDAPPVIDVTGSAPAA